MGPDLTVVGRINGTAVGGIRVALERQGFPFQSGFSEVATSAASSKGTFSFNVASLFETTQFRVVTRTAHADLERHPHGVERGARRHRSSRAAAAGRASRARLAERPAGAYRCRSARRAGAGRSSSARQRRRSTRTARATGSRSRKPKRKRPAARYRVVVLARDGGAHVPGRSREVRVAAAAQAALNGVRPR